MSAAQPPEHDRAGERTEAGGSGANGDTAATRPSGPAHPAAPAPGTYDFHGEQLDFDPYRFGAPEPATRPWTPPAGGPTGPGGAPAPGQRWSPEGDGPPVVRPGDFWQGGGAGDGAGSGSGGAPGTGPAAGGPVFPPPGYTPPAGAGPQVDLHKPTGGHTGGHRAASSGDQAGASPSGPPGYPGYPSGGYPPPGSSPYGPPPGPGSGYPPASGQPWGTPASKGNGIAVAGFVVALVALVGFLLNWIAVAVGLVGLGLSIAGRVKAARGGAHKTLATWGIVIAAVAIIAAGAVLVYVLSRVDFDCLRGLGTDAGNAEQCIR